MKLKASKTMVVFRSRTMYHQPITLTIGRTVLKESDDLDLWRVTFDSKMTLRRIFAWFPEQLPKGIWYREEILASISR